jgi:transcriptional regulator with XRE-family HTH domain
MTFGTKLLKLREKNRLSQQEVADLIGVSQNTYSRWESDLSTFKIEFLPKLAEVFKVDPTELIPQGTTVNIVNSGSQKIDNSVVGFEINMDAKELYKDLLASKNEIIRLLKDEIDKLRNKVA